MTEENNRPQKEVPAHIHEAHVVETHESAPVVASPRRSFNRTLVLRFVVAIIILFLCYFVLYFATANVLPGSILYPLKVRVLEEVMPLFRFGAASDGAYQLTLMERRVNELIALENKGEISDDTFAQVHAQIGTHRRNLTDIVAEHEDGALTRGESLTLLRDFVSSARAAEIVFEENGANSELEEQIEDTRREMKNLYEDKVDQFVAKSDDAEVKGYLDAELNMVTTLTEGLEMDRELDDDVGDALDEVGDALTEIDVAGAITAASEAVRYLQVDSLLRNLDTTQVSDSIEPSSVTDE